MKKGIKPPEATISQGVLNPISIAVFVLLLGLIALLLFQDELLSHEDAIPWLVAIIGVILALLIAASIKIAEALQHTLDEHTNPWGVTCQNVGIKDIVIPAALADAMSKQAQAERERQARIVLGTAETEISEKFAEASKQYLNNPVALQLRGMNMLFEGLKEKGSLIIVPSAALESMNLGAIGGLAALSETSMIEEEVSE